MAKPAKLPNHRPATFEIANLDKSKIKILTDKFNISECSKFADELMQVHIGYLAHKHTHETKKVPRDEQRKLFINAAKNADELRKCILNFGLNEVIGIKKRDGNFSFDEIDRMEEGLQSFIESCLFASNATCAGKKIPDYPLRDLIKKLHDLYVIHTGDERKYTFKDGNYTGPFVEFVEIVFMIFGVRKSVGGSIRDALKSF